PASHDPRAGAGHRPVAVSGQAEPPAGTTTTTRPEPTVRQSPQAQATDYSQMRRRLKGSAVRNAIDRDERAVQHQVSRSSLRALAGARPSPEARGAPGLAAD